MVKKERRTKEAVTREYTINLHKKLHSTKFKGKAPRAVKEIKAFAKKIMGTGDVRLDVKLNQLVWSKGVRNVPTRIRVVISRRRNDDEDAKVRRAADGGVARPARGPMPAAWRGIRGAANARRQPAWQPWLGAACSGLWVMPEVTAIA